MKFQQIQIGSVYLARISKRFVNVRVDNIREEWDRMFDKQRRIYDVTNLTTGRKLTFRSAAKFRRLVTVKQAAEKFAEAMKPKVVLYSGDCS